MADINWALLAPALNTNYAGLAQQGFQQGQQAAEAAGVRNALADYANNPANPRAMAYITAHSPELAMHLQDRARQEATLRATRNALGNLIGDDGSILDPGTPSPGGRPNALTSSAPVSTGPGTPNALSPSPPPSFASAGAAGVDPIGGAGTPATKAPSAIGAGADPASSGTLPPLRALPHLDAATNDRRLTAWRTLAQANPELFGKLREMSTKEQAALAADLDHQIEVSARFMNSVNKVPPENRAAYYQQQKPVLEAAGVQGLPDQWDDQAAAEAVGRITMGMKVKEAVDADREAANTASEIQRRKDETAIGWDRNAIDERNNIRTTSTSRANNQDTNATSRDNNVRTTTQSNTNNVRTTTTSAGNNARTTAVAATKGRGRRGGGGAAAVAVGPNGHQIVVRGGRWVDAQTGQPVS